MQVARFTAESLRALRARLAQAGLILIVLAAFSACGDDAPNNGSQTCEAGDRGCACTETGACMAPGTFCDDGICADVTCALGSEGCACFLNDTCGTGENGALRCLEGECVVDPSACVPGEPGCQCVVGDCDGEFVCTDGICGDPYCPNGANGCACDEGRRCDGGLACVQGACEPLGACSVGDAGCPCSADFRCNGGMVCNATDRCEPADCPAGDVGCACDEGSCVGGATCEDGRCQEDACPAGTEGCGCAAGDTCGMSTLGEALECQSGRCQAPSCTPGESGCVCAGGVNCGDGTVCDGGYCKPESCAPGSEGCGCLAGSCLRGLTCRDGAVCVDATGRLGGACFANGTCDTGHRCQDDRCFACSPGTTACSCDDGECATGLACVGDRCVPEESLGAEPPEDPVCYTPCSTSATLDDGTFIDCRPDGVFAGCLPGRECVNGSCRAPGEIATVCGGDSDCPAHQTCLRGACYSQCATDTDCGDGLSCQRRVCRVPCDTAVANACGAGRECVPVDGETGFCHAVAPGGGGEPTMRTSEGFEIAPDVLTFTAQRARGSFSVVNTLPERTTYRIRKLDHFVRSGATFERRMDLDDDEACTPTIDCPMVWVSMGPLGDEDRRQEYEVELAPDEAVEIIVDASSAPPGRMWTGTFQIVADNDEVGPREVSVNYTSGLDGQWSGQVIYFGEFGTSRLDEWAETPETRNDPELQQDIGNAFMQHWGAFRRGASPLSEFAAMLAATRSESWRFQSVQDACPSAACFLSDSSVAGVSTFSSDLEDFPVPTGVVEMPMAINVHTPDARSPERLTGRIESALALQYAGNPALSLEFANDPAGCSIEAFGNCLTYVDSMTARAAVGGRYLADDSRCRELPGEAVRFTAPWLLPAFDANTAFDADVAGLVRPECRSAEVPFDPALAEDPALTSALNAALAGANPIPDGRARQRELSIIDGVLVNGSELMLVFTETFDSFLDPSDDVGFSSYGIIYLRRSDVELDPADENANGVEDIYEGNVPHVATPEPDGLLATTCSPDVQRYIQPEIDAGAWSDVVGLLVNGRTFASAPELVNPSTEAIHYLCVETGLIDGGAENVSAHGVALVTNNDSCGTSDNGLCEDGGYNAGLGPALYEDEELSALTEELLEFTDEAGTPSELIDYFQSEIGSDARPRTCALGTDQTDCGTRQRDDADVRVACPPGSDVVYFTVDPSALSQADIAALPCQDTGTCGVTVERWRTGGGPMVQYEPLFRCEDPFAATCDANRYDLRDGKEFYAASAEEAVFVPLGSTVDRAFQYATRFRARDGDSVGFTPDLCAADVSARNPYCYDASLVEDASDRVDCLLWVWDEHYDELSGEAESTLMEALLTAFSYSEEPLFPGAEEVGLYRRNPGLMRRWAELSIMLGDDAFTKAFASRFDLAGSRSTAFVGSEFEEGGIDLTGAAGYEMHLLYQATQYYDQVLHRFYATSPLIYRSIERPLAEDFVTPETVVTYMDKLVLASTRNARAWSEIARRYQAFNRPNLARRVIERQYTATYLESMVLTRMLLRIVDTSAATQRPQILALVEDAQRRYRLALSNMLDVYQGVTDEQTFLGIAPDYVPFPVVDTVGASPFEVVYNRANTLLLLAKERDERAISSSRGFETDTEQFRSELVRIRNTYDQQLGELCGTFVADDDRVLPAVTRYADLSDETRAIGDPCGFVNNGRLFQTRLRLQEAMQDIEEARLAERQTIERIRIEQERVARQCGLIYARAAYTFRRGNEEYAIEEYINGLGRARGTADRIYNFASTMIGFASQISSDGIKGAALAGAAGAQAGTYAAYEVTNLVLDELTETAQADLSNFRAETTRAVTESECAAARIDSDARVAEELLRLHENALAQAQAMRSVVGVLGDLQSANNDVQRILAEQAESEQLLINTEAARNDPNVRILRNDAVINADIAFENALREAYRATLVFEYYTSQTYVAREQLYLIRLAASGEYNLENYLTDLYSAFIDFEDEYGTAARRVAVLSLRDDILRVPRIGDNGRALDETERVEIMRERLQDPEYIDENGDLVVRFSTDFDLVSPATRLHRIDYLEADVSGRSVGDSLGRVYVRMLGTGTISALDESRRFYRFPQRTAVINTFFQGHRFYEPDVYKNDRLRFRPVVNTDLELVINQRTEAVNQDIDLASLNDIRLYIHYTDFTPD